MQKARRPLLAANWKMYKSVADSLNYAEELVRRADEWVDLPVDLLICPTALALWAVGQKLASYPVRVGAQNLDLGTEGAMTGALSARLIRAAGAQYVILGHSERRQHFGETDRLVAEKSRQALDEGLIPIVCVGENDQENQQGLTTRVIQRQLAPVLEKLGSADAASFVVAYEPIWAIGTGKVPTFEDAQRVAQDIRQGILRQWGEEAASAVRVLYGGSVSPDNIAGFAAQPDIDGALIGGASLKVDNMVRMVQQWQEADKA
mgnify:CR=1 FL=1